MSCLSAIDIFFTTNNLYIRSAYYFIMQKLFSTLMPGSNVPSLHGECNKPFGSGFNFMEFYKNLSLENLTCWHEGIFYTEEWEAIKGYDGRYFVSNFGRVKSCKEFNNKRKNTSNVRNTIFTSSLDKRGYPRIALLNKKLSTSIRIHILVWDHFGDKPRNGRIIQVDHIDDNKLNNAIWNLQILTNRENSIKRHLNSRYLTGAFHSGKKWRSAIKVKGKYMYLGIFETEKEAHKAYQKTKESLCE